MSNVTELSKIRRSTIVSQVMEKLRILISSGQYKTGDRLPTEDELARQLGIGRSSIRESIKVLNYLGVLDSQAAKGTFVCERSSISAEALTWSILLGRDDYQDLINTRGAIEAWSLLLLTERFVLDPASMSDILISLEMQVDRMRRALETEDKKELANADYDFHSAIITSCGNSLITAIYTILRSFTYEEIERTHDAWLCISTIIEDHEDFIAAIKNGNSCMAQRVVKRHIDGIMKNLTTPLKSVP